MLRCLALFAGFPGKRAAIAGNHDVWCFDGRDALERYRGLPDLFRRSGFHPLEEEPFVRDGVGFAGAMGWYDLSFRDEDLGIPPESYRDKCYPGREPAIWGDVLHARWHADDAAVAAWQADRLERQLASLAGAKDVIVVLHHVPTKQLLFHPRCLVPRHWRFLNAFLGSERLSAIALRARGVSLVVNGHVHMAGAVTMGDTRFVSIGGDYRTKQLVVKDGRRVMRLAFTS